MLELKSLRKKKNLSQKGLAKLFNIAQNTISNWENGIREPSAETLTKLADLFEVSVDYLLGRTDMETPYTRNNDHIFAEEIAQVVGNLGSDLTRQLCCLRKLTDEEKVSLTIFLEGLHARRQQKNH